MGLCNSLANCWSLEVIAVPMWLVVSLELCFKKLFSFEASPCWYPSYYGLLAIPNPLSLITLSETVLLGGSLYVS